MNGIKEAQTDLCIVIPYLEESNFTSGCQPNYSGRSSVSSHQK